MTGQEHAAPNRQGPPSDAEAHPEQAVDELEEQVLGRRVDQVRDEKDGPGDEQARDEPGPGTEPP